MDISTQKLEKIADSIATEAIIAYTQTTILTPEEAFRLNNIIFEIARSELFRELILEEVSA